MKGKFSSIWRLGLALVLVLGMSLVMAAPVAAAAVGTPTVALSSYLASAADVQYTISFNLGLSLTTGNKITIDFNDAYVSPATVANNDVTIDDVGILGTAVVITQGTDTWEITLAAPISTSTNPVVVVITSAANLPNPAAGSSYTVSVSTSAETAATSAVYAILALPTVSTVSPDKGNVGDTMWVEVAGTGFTGTATACTTTFSFGAGASVVSGSYHWITATEIDCQITITAAGTLAVAATSTAGTGTVTGLFTASLVNTKQVDVWDTYTPEADLAAGTWDAATLALQSSGTYTTLTAAVNAATASDIVIVHAATYSTGETFPITIADNGLTLKSLSGATSTTISETSEGYETIQVTTPEVTIGGSGAGFTIITKRVAGIRVPVGSTTGATGLRILYNTFKAVDQGESHGIWIEADLVNGTQTAQISYNDFSQSSAWVEGAGQGAPGTAILIARATSAIINNNTASNQKYTFLAFKPEKKQAEAGGSGEVDLGAASTIDGVNIYSNVVHGNGLQAIRFSYRGAATFDIGFTTAVKIYKNQFYNNGEGIRIDNFANLNIGDGTPTYGIVVNYNDIYDNDYILRGTPKNYGIFNEANAGEDVDARYNWWGAIGGPAAGTNALKSLTALGNGDFITTDVVYNPWLSEPYDTVIDEGIRYYGSDTLALQEGWNTLSVPLKLYDYGNTIAEIKAMGDFLTTANYANLIYEYDSVNGFVTPTTLVPCRGYYIKMLAASSFPVFYSNSLGLPSLALSAGWNLIGSAFGIDKATEVTWAVANSDPNNDGNLADADTEALKFVGAAMNSIKAQASVVVSPSAPGQLGVPWAVAYEATDTTNKMYTGEAYWVFMTASGTLAGFEITPFYFVWAP